VNMADDWSREEVEAAVADYPIASPTFGLVLLSPF